MLKSSAVIDSVGMMHGGCGGYEGVDVPDRPGSLSNEWRMLVHLDPCHPDIEGQTLNIEGQLRY